MRRSDAYAAANGHGRASYCYHRALAYGGSIRNADPHRRPNSDCAAHSPSYRAAYADSYAHACANGNGCASSAR